MVTEKALFLKKKKDIVINSENFIDAYSISWVLAPHSNSLDPLDPNNPSKHHVFFKKIIHQVQFLLLTCSWVEAQPVNRSPPPRGHTSIKTDCPFPRSPHLSITPQLEVGDDDSTPWWNVDWLALAQVIREGSPSVSRIYICSYICMHICINNSCIHMLTHIHIYTHTHIFSCIHTCTLKCTHARTYKTCTNKCAHVHIHTCQPTYAQHVYHSYKHSS